MRLENKSAIITGAGGGIGRAIAETFAREGCRVIVADVFEQKAHVVAESIRSSGGDATAYVVDVSKRDEVAALVRKGVETFGRLDVMVNNAGVSEATWEEMLRVNLSGVAYGIRFAARAMVESGGGSIISTSSVGGLIGEAGPIDSGTDAYVASKHGVVGVTKESALEYGIHGIRINCVCPGPVDTDMLKRYLSFPETRARLEGRTALRRVASPQEIANAFLFLASDESSYVTGTALVVDGGWTAG